MQEKKLLFGVFFTAASVAATNAWSPLKLLRMSVTPVARYIFVAGPGLNMAQRL